MQWLWKFEWLINKNTNSKTGKTKDKNKQIKKKQMNIESPDSDGLEFDPNDEVSYYYGNLTRDQVKEILNDSSIGTFLIRDSTKDEDQKVMCVK